MKWILPSLLICVLPALASELSYDSAKGIMEHSKFGKITPGETEISEVENLIGKPIRLIDLKPSGKKKLDLQNAYEPLLEYKSKDRWQVLIYAVKSNFRLLIKYKPGLENKVGQICFIPKKHTEISVDTLKMKKEYQNGNDIFWIDRDGGRFEISINAPQTDGNKVKGKLNSMSIVPSEKYARKASK